MKNKLLILFMTIVAFGLNGSTGRPRSGAVSEKETSKPIGTASSTVTQYSTTKFSVSNPIAKDKYEVDKSCPTVGGIQGPGFSFRNKTKVNVKIQVVQTSLGIKSETKEVKPDQIANLKIDITKPTYLLTWIGNALNINIFELGKNIYISINDGKKPYSYELKTQEGPLGWAGSATQLCFVKKPKLSAINRIITKGSDDIKTLKHQNIIGNESDIINLGDNLVFSPGYFYK